MNTVTAASKEEFLQQLDELIGKRLEAAAAKRVKAFARLYFAHLPLDELTGRRLTDLYGAMLTAWQFIQERKGEEPGVAVFNPELEQDGWHSTHTIVFVLHPNIPFLIDSLRMAINQRELTIHNIHHAVMDVRRSRQGQLESVVDINGRGGKKRGTPVSEALIVLEVDRHSDGTEQEGLRENLLQVLEEVRIAVGDFAAMREKAQAIIDELDQGPPNLADETVREARAFMEWLLADHFTFLGYDEYDFVTRGKDTEIRQLPDSELGILRSHNERPSRLKLGKMPARTRREMTRNDELFIFAKSAQRSRVHRPAYPDYIAVKKFDKEGNVVGERRFLGLYTSRVYHQRPDEIPVLRRKFEAVLDNSGFNRNDYAGKELEQILTVYPRDELFQIETGELLKVALDILYIQERQKIRLYMREDVYGQFVTCLVFVPREIYCTELRLDMERVLGEALDAVDIEFNTYFSESILARTQFNVRVRPVENRVLPVAELQEKIIELAQSWRDGLVEALIESHGEERGSQLIQQYENAFPASYRDMFSPRRAAVDVDHIVSTAESGRLSMSFYRALEESDDQLHFKLFNRGDQLPLSDVMPIFENFGFRVIGEHPFETRDRRGRVVWIHDFMLQSHHGEKVDIPRLRPLFETLFLMIWEGEAESDTFNRLVSTAYLGWREIAMLRAYARYMRQIRISNSQYFIASTLVSHANLTRLLLDFFDVRFNPARYHSEGQCQAAQQRLEIEFNAGLDNVSNLSEDRVLRLYLDLMKATLRTNYFQTEAGGGPKSYISYKIKPDRVPEMPRPVLMYEIFVYSPRVEGVHLRGGRVARGGLRWSDRFEDFRTEILGLVKAQQVKNAVIVPVGAKGGFVAKRLPEEGSREAIQEEGIAAYKTFIRGLLDLTDNFIDGEVIPPADTLRHDGNDYYLVVAADKGTATFSDIANGIAADYGFWLGDAFASGGSHGYDHKKMGITARGAWVSVERHFREMGVNTREDDFTVIGIGDMGGDVFGNGMLLSRHIKLVAAFNHLHIFIDPDPDPEKSFNERKRLFELPRSSWEDYDSSLISQGGGVFSRAAKSIPISPEMKKCLGIKADRMPPNMLISNLLRAQVDLLWFGGIGTYVKASQESHADVGDKANDGLRVDGRELRCKVIGEGGNLGMTQLGRIEFALAGGRLNTDFIDNSGGVDCSDHEVNIKILLNRLVANGDMTSKQRNELLEAMTEQVAELVLTNNYRQTQALSIASESAFLRLEEYRRLMHSLESEEKLDRRLEFLPDDEALNDRKLQEKGLTRPELSILIAYVKAGLKESLTESDLPDNPILADEIKVVFPAMLIKRYGRALEGHQLRREIIATQIANDMVNHMGITFVERLRQSTGAGPAAVALAYQIARRIYRLPQRWGQIEALDYQVPSSLQIRLMGELMRLIRRSCRWLLRNRRSELSVEHHSERFTGHLDAIAADFSSYLWGQDLEEWKKTARGYEKQGLPADLAGVIAGTSYLYSSLGIIEAHENTGVPLKRVANLYFCLGERLQLNWFSHAINDLAPTSHWQALARESFREDLDWQQRALTEGVLQNMDPDEPLEDCLDRWSSVHTPLIERWNSMLVELRASPDPEYAMFSVALRELLDLAQSTRHMGDVVS